MRPKTAAPGHTLVTASTLDGSLRESVKSGGNVAAAKAVGKLIAERSLAVLRDGTIGILYERGDASPYERITFARFPLRFKQADPAERFLLRP